jgi:opine dehydrogenase
VIGSGAGGRAVAADFARHAHAVTLFEFQRFAAGAEGLRKEGAVRTLEDGETTVAKLACVTSDPAEAFEAADLVVPVVAAVAHQLAAEALTPCLRAGQVVCFFGEGSGSLVLARLLEDRAGVSLAEITVAEANTLPYMARLTPDGRAVTVRRKSGGFIVAGLPAGSTSRVVELLRPVYPFVRAGENVLETVLLNFNAIDHVCPMVLNAGTLEAAAGEFRLWGAGGTAAVVRAIDAVDGEILALRAALGFSDRTAYRDFLYEQGFLQERKASTYEAIHGSALAEITLATGPDALKMRFLTEDVPCALTLIASIGDALDVQTPAIDALITLAGILLEEDYWSTGRTLRSLGLPRDRAGLLAAVGARVMAG